MTAQKDLIGIVKELQNEQDRLLGMAQIGGGEIYVEASTLFERHTAWHFRPIAQALLIAVEALEKIESVEPTELADDIAAFANNALSRIHSLSKP